MADYYSLEQLVHKMGMTGGEIMELLAKASFSPTVKHGRQYYSARQFSQLQAALRLARRHNVSFEEGLQMVFERVSRLKQVSVG